MRFWQKNDCACAVDTVNELWSNSAKKKRGGGGDIMLWGPIVSQLSAPPFTDASTRCCKNVRTLQIFGAGTDWEKIEERQVNSEIFITKRTNAQRYKGLYSFLPAPLIRKHKAQTSRSFPQHPLPISTRPFSSWLTVLSILYARLWRSTILYFYKKEDLDCGISDCSTA